MQSVRKAGKKALKGGSKVVSTVDHGYQIYKTAQEMIELLSDAKELMRNDLPPLWQELRNITRYMLPPNWDGVNADSMITTLLMQEFPMLSTGHGRVERSQLKEIKKSVAPVFGILDRIQALNQQDVRQAEKEAQKLPATYQTSVKKKGSPNKLGVAANVMIAAGIEQTHTGRLVCMLFDLPQALISLYRLQHELIRLSNSMAACIAILQRHLEQINRNTGLCDLVERALNVVTEYYKTESTQSVIECSQKAQGPEPTQDGSNIQGMMSFFTTSIASVKQQIIDSAFLEHIGTVSNTLLDLSKPLRYGIYVGLIEQEGQDTEQEPGEPQPSQLALIQTHVTNACQNLLIDYIKRSGGAFAGSLSQDIPKIMVKSGRQYGTKMLFTAALTYITGATLPITVSILATGMSNAKVQKAMVLYTHSLLENAFANLATVGDFAPDQLKQMHLTVLSVGTQIKTGECTRLVDEYIPKASDTVNKAIKGLQDTTRWVSNKAGNVCMQTILGALLKEPQIAAFVHAQLEIIIGKVLLDTLKTLLWIPTDQPTFETDADSFSSPWEHCVMAASAIGTRDFLKPATVVQDALEALGNTLKMPRLYDSPSSRQSFIESTVQFLGRSGVRAGQATMKVAHPPIVGVCSATKKLITHVKSTATTGPDSIKKPSPTSPGTQQVVTTYSQPQPPASTVGSIAGMSAKAASTGLQWILGLDDTLGSKKSRYAKKGCYVHLVEDTGSLDYATLNAPAVIFSKKDTSCCIKGIVLKRLPSEYSAYQKHALVAARLTDIVSDRWTAKPDDSEPDDSEPDDSEPDDSEPDDSTPDKRKLSAAEYQARLILDWKAYSDPTIAQLYAEHKIQKIYSLSHQNRLPSFNGKTNFSQRMADVYSSQDYKEKLKELEKKLLPQFPGEFDAKRKVGTAELAVEMGILVALKNDYLPVKEIPSNLTDKLSRLVEKRPGENKIFMPWQDEVISYIVQQHHYQDRGYVYDTFTCTPPQKSTTETQLEVFHKNINDSVTAALKLFADCKFDVNNMESRLEQISNRLKGPSAPRITKDSSYEDVCFKALLECEQEVLKNGIEIAKDKFKATEDKILIETNRLAFCKLLLESQPGDFTAENVSTVQEVEKTHYFTLLAPVKADLAAAVHHFEQYKFETTNIEQRLQDITTALQALDKSGLSPKSIAYLVILLTGESEDLKVHIKSAREQFDSLNLLKLPIGQRLQTVKATLMSGDKLTWLEWLRWSPTLPAPAKEHYICLLKREDTALENAISTFKTYELDKIEIVSERHQRIVDSLSRSDGPLKELLTTEKHDIERHMQEAETAFASLKEKCSKITTAEGRRKAVANGLANPKGAWFLKGKLHPIAEKHYLALVETLEVELQAGADQEQAACTQAAQTKFDAYHFDATANIASRRQAVQAALRDVATLGIANPIELAHLTTLLTQRLDTLNQTMQEAQARFNAHHVDAEPNIALRLQAVQAALNGVTAIPGIDATEAAHLTALLTQRRDALNQAMLAAEARFDAHHFDAEGNIALRQQAVQAALGGVAGLGLDVNQTAHLTALLTQRRDALNQAMLAAEARFDAHHFDAEGNIALRQQAVQAALGGVAELRIADANESAHLEQMLTAQLQVLTQTMLDAQARFDGYPFHAELNIAARRQALQAALNGVAALGLNVNQAAYLSALLTQRLDALDQAMAAAQGRFDAQVRGFDTIANIAERRRAVQTTLDDARTAPAGLGLTDEVAHLNQLLTERLPTRLQVLDQAIAAAQGRFDAQVRGFDAELNVAARRQAVHTALTGIAELPIADANQAAHLNQLLTQRLEELDRAIAAAQARFDAQVRGFDAIANIGQRQQAVQAALDGVADLRLDANQAAHLRALLSTKQDAVAQALAASQAEAIRLATTQNGNLSTQSVVLQQLTQTFDSLSVDAQRNVITTIVDQAVRGNVFAPALAALRPKVQEQVSSAVVQQALQIGLSNTAVNQLPPEMQSPVQATVVETIRNIALSDQQRAADISRLQPTNLKQLIYRGRFGI